MSCIVSSYFELLCLILLICFGLLCLRFVSFGFALLRFVSFVWILGRFVSFVLFGLVRFVLFDFFVFFFDLS